MAPSVNGRARLSVCVCLCDLCVCVGDRLGVGAGDGSGRGLRSVSAWPVLSGLGWLLAPPRSGRVSGRPCGFLRCVARGPGHHSAQSLLPLSSPCRAVGCITLATSVCW